MARASAVCLALCAGCMTHGHNQIGASTTYEAAPIPGLTLRSVGAQDPDKVWNLLGTSALKVGPDAVEASMGLGLAHHVPLTPELRAYVLAHVDVLGAGYTLGTSYPHISAMGPGLEAGFTWKPPHRKQDRMGWWSVSVFVDHDARFGPDRATYMGVQLGSFWGTP